VWASDIEKALQRGNSLLERFAAEPEEATTTEKIRSISQSLRLAAHDVWSGESENVFNPWVTLRLIS
jgi:hypothetical protein